MNVLICGGAGYIGGALTDLLPKARVYDNLTYEEHYLKPREFVYGDILDRKKLKEQLEWADCVVWLAALVGDGACAIDPELTEEINQDSVKWLADNFDGRIIFTSTCSVYGARDGILDEDSPTNPLSAYAETKLAAEKYLEGKNAIIFRLGTLFGQGDTFSRVRFDLVVNTLVAKGLSKGEIKVFGGEQYRPLLHVKDVARAIYMNINSEQTGVYNLFYKNMKIFDLAQKICQQTDCELSIVGSTFEDSRNYRVTSKLEFMPTYDLQDGIKEISNLINDGRIKDLENPRYSNKEFLCE